MEADASCPHVVVLDSDRRVVLSQSLEHYKDDNAVTVRQVIEWTCKLQNWLTQDMGITYVMVHDDHDRRWDHAWEVPMLPFDHTVFRLVNCGLVSEEYARELDNEYLSNAARIMKRSWENGF